MFYHYGKNSDREIQLVSLPSAWPRCVWLLCSTKSHSRRSLAHREVSLTEKSRESWESWREQSTSSRTRECSFVLFLDLKSWDCNDNRELYRDKQDFRVRLLLDRALVRHNNKQTNQTKVRKHVLFLCWNHLMTEYISLSVAYSTLE